MVLNPGVKSGGGLTFEGITRVTTIGTVSKPRLHSGSWWARQDLNLHGLLHGILSPACLPIPPRAPNLRILAATPP